MFMELEVATNILAEIVIHFGNRSLNATFCLWISTSSGAEAGSPRMSEDILSIIEQEQWVLTPTLAILDQLPA